MGRMYRINFVYYVYGRFALRDKMIPVKIALICCFLPLVSVHLTLMISIASENLHACIPYWSYCHSISATGRQYPEFFVFKALLIPSAVFMSIYWLLMHHWLQRITQNKQSPALITSMGIVASLALIVYTVTLGAPGDSYALARRIGVVFYFAFTSFAHLILLRYLDKIDTRALGIVSEQNKITVICALLVISAIASAIIGMLWEGWDNWENAYEWWFSLAMIALFYLVARMWRKTRYQLALSVNKDVSAVNNDISLDNENDIK